VRANRAASHSARVSLVDPLTGLHHRDRLQQRLKDEAARAALRCGGGLVGCEPDLDNFKAFNDRYGHIAGTGRPRQSARVLCGTGRRSDRAFRCGGEGFVLLSP
jgi:diguanylate cyclase (GGDEF)-like protein